MENPHRLNFDIEKSVNDRLNAQLPAGTKSLVLRILVTKLVERLETPNKAKVLGLLLAEEFDISALFTK